jgi:hypothetical protein
VADRQCISPEDWERLREFFTRRNWLSHNIGAADYGKLRDRSWPDWDLKKANYWLAFSDGWRAAK